MTTLVIDRQTLPETLLSFIGSPRVLVSAESDRVVLTPVTDEAEFDGPDGKYIDPADYEDETAYLSAIPGLVERLIAYRNLPDSEFTPIPREYFSV